ncbi:MAG: hypothetical protein AAB887_01660 [Patescibacteria group bacterium]
MSRLVDVLKKADVGEIVGVAVVVVIGFLALWLGRSLKKEGFPPDVDPPGAL